MVVAHPRWYALVCTQAGWLVDARFVLLYVVNGVMF